MDVKSRLEERLERSEKEFAKLREEEFSIVEQGKELNRQLSRVRTRMVQLQGVLEELGALRKDFPEKEKKK